MIVHFILRFYFLFQANSDFQWLLKPFIVQFILFPSLKQTAFTENATRATLKPSAIGRRIIVASILIW